ncbi:hypothetical protein [Phenylobacterium sp.]|uniref:hypothetical protein n=1 Tax=Phenylobacterium sp. TaxID=1871053 RepID=UPI0025EDA63D|nr:hypothetical protein [Phenylobacterium sp.]
MDFAYENPELEAAIAGAADIEALDQALVRLSRLVPSFLAPEVRGHQMFTPGLDALAPRIATRLRLSDVPLAKSNDNVCIVATRFYGTGGHSRVASDISRLVGAERTTIVFTDLYRELRPRLLIPGVPAAHACRSLMLLSAGTIVEKIIELYMLLAAIRPSRIFLIQNHMDMAAVAGVWPFRSVVEYVHHTDHQPGLGATLPFSAHMDLTYACHQACRGAGLDATWTGMTVPARATPTQMPEGTGRGLRIATCGSQYKYLHPAAHRWSDFVVAALSQAPDADFVHFGPVDEALTRSVHEPLAAAGIDAGRYRFLGAVPDLREALIAHGADAYLASYPDSGGRANLEALAAGLAPVAPTPAQAGPLLRFDLPLPYWLRIETPDEVSGALARSVELSRSLRSARGQADLAAEFGRFEDYVRTGAAAPA